MWILRELSITSFIILSGREKKHEFITMCYLISVFWIFYSDGKVAKVGLNL